MASCLAVKDSAGTIGVQGSDDFEVSTVQEMPLLRIGQTNAIRLFWRRPGAPPTRPRICAVLAPG